MRILHALLIAAGSAVLAAPALAQSDEVILHLPGTADANEAPTLTPPDNAVAPEPMPDTSPGVDGIAENQLCYEQFYEGGDDAAAIEHCTRAIESGDLIEADLVAALINRGVAYKKLGQLDKAIADYSNALERAPSDGMLYANRANAYYEQYRYDAAINDANKAIAFAPEYPAAYYVRGSIFEALGQKDFARNDFLRAAELAPDNEAYKEKAWTYGANQAP